MFNFFKKKPCIITINTNLSDEESKRIDEKIRETHKEFENASKVKEKYKDVIEQYISITDELWNKNTYKLVNSQPNIFNEYADRYIELCNMYLQILPEYIKYDIEMGKAHNEKRTINYAPQDIVNMIRLLEKQEKYNEIINVCKYLLSLGITEDGTKKGIKGRIEKAIENFNNKFNTNFAYDTKKDLIIDNITGEIMYASIDT